MRCVVYEYPCYDVHDTEHIAGQIKSPDHTRHMANPKEEREVNPNHSHTMYTCSTCHVQVCIHSAISHEHVHNRKYIVSYVIHEVLTATFSPSVSKT